MSKVSVILPVLHFVPMTLFSIQSVLRQSHRDLELLIVDNSPAQNLPIALLPPDPRIRVIRAPDTQADWFARNAALRVVEGQFIAMLDSEDAMAGDHLEQALQTLSATKADLYSVGYVNYDAATQKAETRIFPLSGRLSFSDLCRRCPMGHSTMVMRAAIRPFYPAYRNANDLALWLRCHRRNLKFVSDQQIKVVRRLSKNSLSANKLLFLTFYWRVLRVEADLGRLKSLIYAVGFVMGQLRRRCRPKRRQTPSAVYGDIIGIAPEEEALG